MSGQVVRALSTMHVAQGIMLTAGEFWASDDPLVLAHPEWFSADLEPALRRSVPKIETTTAEPDPARAKRDRKVKTTDAEPEVTRV